MESFFTSERRRSEKHAKPKLKLRSKKYDFDRKQLSTIAVSRYAMPGDGSRME
jgi:hypothetical protein